MRYLMVFVPKNPADANRAPTDREIAEMGQLIDEMAKAGVLLHTDGLQPNGKADARLRYAGGRFTITDGPFTEAKELIAGFAILQVQSKEEALEWGKRFMKVAGDEGTGELRLMYDVPAYPPQKA